MHGSERLDIDFRYLLKMDKSKTQRSTQDVAIVVRDSYMQMR